MRFKLPFLAGASLLILSSCDPVGPSGGSSNGTFLESGTYHVSADGQSLIVDLGHPACQDSVLVRDTEIDSTPYALSGNVLTIRTSSNLDDGFFVQETLTLKRASDGNALQGTWVEQSDSYALSPAGDMNAEDDTALKGDSLFNSYTTQREWVFTADSAYSYGNVQAARFFVHGWSSDYQYYTDESVTATYVSQYVARLTGGVTGEVVTVTFSPDDNVETFSSSVSGHATSSMYLNPVSCPNPDAPGWYYMFPGDQQDHGSRSDGHHRPAPARPRKLHRRGLF